MPTPLRKQFPATNSLLPEAGDRAVLARISTTTVDRDGEVLLSQGCDASDFLKSPTVFFNHDYDLPIGRCAAIHRTPDTLEAKTIFATRPPDHAGPWLPDTVLSLFQQGVINGFSVGFAPIEARRPTRRDLELFGDKTRYVYSKWKLLEYSVAPLPANQDALALAVSKALPALPPEIIKRLFPTLPLTSDIRHQTSEIPLPPPRRLLLLLPPKPPAPQLSLPQRIDRAILKARGQLYV